MKFFRNRFFSAMLMLVTTSSFAQVGINTSLPNAQLDVRSSNQAAPSANDGILIPKVDAFPAVNPTAAQQAMLVYLTTVSGANQPGFYYWNFPTLSWIGIDATTNASLDHAYDAGGPGNGSTINADSGAVKINGIDGLVCENTASTLAEDPPAGAGIRMFWNPRRSAFRAGRVIGTNWDIENIGAYSAALGYNCLASGYASFAVGQTAIADENTSIALGSLATASGQNAFAAGSEASALSAYAVAFGRKTTAYSTAETVFGIGSTIYTPIGAGPYFYLPTAAHLNDRLFVIGNAYDQNLNGVLDAAERRDAMVMLKSGFTGFGTPTPQRHFEISGGGQQFSRITSTATDVVGFELKRNGSDWQMRNDAGILYFGQSNDDLITVASVLRLGGGSVTPGVDSGVTLGQPALRWTNVYAVNGTIQTSDATDKKRIDPIENGLDKIRKLRPVSFQWKDNAIDNGQKHLGFIAQEVQKVLPEVVVDSDWIEGEEGVGKIWVKNERLGMKYSEIIPVLVKAVQEQQQQIESQQKLIDQLLAESASK